MAFDDLYQEIILDHAKNPRNKENLDFISDDEVHENPTCGDSIKLAVDFFDDGKIERVLFDGDGCVVKYPMRVKCATLPWHALEDSLG